MPDKCILGRVLYLGVVRGKGEGPPFLSKLCNSKSSSKDVCFPGHVAVGGSLHIRGMEDIIIHLHEKSLSQIQWITLQLVEDF